MRGSRFFARLPMCVVALACFLGTASAASAAPITINPGSYAGRYYFPGFNGTYWDSSSSYERDRAVFQLYMPLIRTVVQAGWKPVNYATSYR